MKRKIARVCMIAAALTTLTALPAFAEEMIPNEAIIMSQVDNGPMAADETVAPEEDSAAPAPIIHPRGFMCYSRNLAGRIFSGFGFVLPRASAMSLVNCRRGSVSIMMARSCRVITCRRILR